MSDHQIQFWLNNGDAQAAEDIYHTYHEQVFRLAYALLGDTGSAEEVLQDTMVYALMRMDRYDSQKSSFTTWLHMITVNLCRDYQKRQTLPKASMSGGGTSSIVINATAGFEKAEPPRENAHKLWHAISQLSHQLREAVVLRYYAAHTYQEIAQILRCPLPTAQSRVRLAYEQLYTLLVPSASSVIEG